MGEPTACIIGISGGSASGKTTFASLAQSYLGEDRCSILYQDSYYKDQSEQFDQDGGAINFDHPDSIDFELMCDHLKLLRLGQSVDVPIYDFKTHRRLTRSQSLSSQPVILVDGILIFCEEKLRELFDFRVFIQTSEETRYQRRLSRDVRERGRTPDGVESQFYNQVKPMHDLFVEPSRHQADVIYSGEINAEPTVRDMISLLKQKGVQGLEVRA